jgi:non-ribosomal peptide synthetase component F/acyl carrier protein
VPGEICIGGDGVAQGYLERPELTADRFVSDPFSDVPGARIYRTGDRGRWRNDGLLEHLGRLDFQVKVRGYRIELGEIEAGCNDVAGVTQSVVLAREDNPGDVRLVAYLQVAAGAVVDEVGLRAHLRGRLPEYMLPQHVVVLDAIPLLPNGKVDRKALPAPVVTHVARTERVAPRTELERTVAAAMQAVLKMPDIGVHDDFFSLGGHSLLAARLIGQLNRDLDVQLSLRTLFESPTVEKLTAAIEQHRGGPALPKREPIRRRDVQDRAPLSLMQERMRFIEEMYPGRVDYNTPSAHRLKGPMNVEAFEQAFNDMLRRQPSLRTRIVATANGFEQLVEDELVVSLLPLEDLSVYPEVEREQELKRRNDALMAQTFTLDQAPLFKVRLYKLGDHDHVLFFMPHHIIWDGWSFDLLYAEMAANYTARLQQRPTELAPPAVSYGDFAQWHNRWLGSEEIRQQVQYWKDQYAEGGAPREPFADQLRESGSGGVGDTAWIKIDAVQAERIRELAKKTGTTLSIVAMSAFTALMSQWLADRRPVIGLPVRGRPMTEIENVMGFFNNMLPMRMPVDMALSGIDWIRSVRQTLLQGYANQDVPFELVAQELDVGRRGAPARLYHVMFTFQDVRQRPTHWGPLAHSRVPVDLKGVTEDINLWLVDAQDGVSGGVRFDTDVYLPQTGAALRDRFIALIDGLVRSPDASLSSLLAPTAAEIEQLQAWARPELPPGNALLPTIDAQIVARGDAAAVHHGERRLSYRELGAAIAGVERALLPGAAPARVVIGVADPFIQLAATLAAWKSGARCWLLDPGADEEVVTQVAAAAHADLWIADAGLHKHASAARWVDASSLGARSVVAHPAPRAVVDGEVVRAPRQGLDPAIVSQTFAALGAQLALRVGDNVLTLPGATRGLPLAGGLLALAAGASWRIEQRLEPGRLRDLMPDQALVLGGTQDVWQAVLEGEHTFAPQAVVALDVRELPAGLVKRLLEQGGRVYSALHADNTGLAVAGGWLKRWQDAGVFGRPLLDLISGLELQVVSQKAQVVPPGMAGDAGLRDATGSVQLLGVPCRWRSDGVLQYLGTPVNYEPPNVQAQPDTNSRPVDAQLSGTERAIAEVWTTLLGQDGISTADNFFELGGTSLMAMQAVSLLEGRLGRRISARRYVFDSLGQLAAAYDEAPSSAVEQPTAQPAAAAPAPAAKGLLSRLAGLVRRT